MMTTNDPQQKSEGQGEQQRNLNLALLPEQNAGIGITSSVLEEPAHSVKTAFRDLRPRCLPWALFPFLLP